MPTELLVQYDTGEDVTDRRISRVHGRWATRKTRTRTLVSRPKTATRFLNRPDRGVHYVHFVFVIEVKREDVGCWDVGMFIILEQRCIKI